MLIFPKMNLNFSEGAHPKNGSIRDWGKEKKREDLILLDITEAGCAFRMEFRPCYIGYKDGIKINLFMRIFSKDMKSHRRR